MDTMIEGPLARLEGGLRRVDWLDGLSVLWPEFEEAASRHRELVETWRAAQRARVDLEAGFDVEDREYLAALEAGDEPEERTPAYERDEARRDADADVEVAARHLRAAVEEVVVDVRDRREELSDLIGEVRATADDLIREAEDLIARAGRLRKSAQGAGLWLQRTITGVDYLPYPDVAPTQSDADLVREWADTFEGERLAARSGHPTHPADGDGMALNTSHPVTLRTAL